MSADEMPAVADDTSAKRSGPRIGLVLSGGGARAAYQVGVLEGIAAIRRQTTADLHQNPFPILTGTSAGAINVVALASGADDFETAMSNLTRVWREFTTSQVYKIDSIAMLDASQRWRFAIGVGRFILKCLRLQPKSLLDNAPLAELLQRLISFERLTQVMHQGHLEALAITASSYGSGENVTFFQCDHRITPWTRNLRSAVADNITLEHVMASSAIPFIFPARMLDTLAGSEYFGDGSMRQTAPLAPAIHLGAERILAIGSGRKIQQRMPGTDDASAIPNYPSIAQIAGHTMSSIFLDTLNMDVERLERINRTVENIPPSFREQSGLRHLELMLFLPSKNIDEIAARHVHLLPGAVRRLVIGGTNKIAPTTKGATFASYLLFEQAFTSELMDLGHSDALARRAELIKFFDWTVRDNTD